MNTTALHLSPILALMPPEGLFFLKVLGVFLLLVLIPVGMMLWRNQERWFGRSSETPNETSGSLGYGAAQSWLVYVGALHLALWLIFG